MGPQAPSRQSMWTGCCDSPAPAKCTALSSATAPQTLPGDGDTRPIANSATDAHGHHAAKNQHQRAAHHAHIPALSSVAQTKETLARPWQKQLPATMEHDRARPGAQVLQVALERLLRQEVHRANGCHGVTCLMDMSTFYDTINLTRLQQEALQLNYPPLMLEMAMQLYTGPKAIVAEQEMTPFSPSKMESQLAAPKHPYWPRPCWHQRSSPGKPSTSTPPDKHRWQ